MKLEHIGIAVRDIEKSNKLFSVLFKQEPYKTEQVDSEGVLTAFYKTGETKIELLQATKPDSAIAKYIDKKGEGIHHLAFEVDNIDEEIERLQKEGFELINKTAKDGADNKRIAFLHPKSANGVLIEICQEKK
ncbi:MAG: methylmalonyl-CoA epimerase [Crocinitomicaceae bacterium]|nr:methylmalonyl-CoA epimerase [Crocinitomicaceae bacterium]MBK8927586.1 methylmalonyl-CoA epimerase [Crocinitomicaceae bacterium]